MTKEELFKKYSIDESHNVWDMSIDNWYSVEIYRAMHNGNLPPEGDASIKWVVDFLNECDKDPNFLISRKNWGSFYMTSKRMIARHYEQILTELDSSK